MSLDFFHGFPVFFYGFPLISQTAISGDAVAQPFFEGHLDGDHVADGGAGGHEAHAQEEVVNALGNPDFFLHGKIMMEVLDVDRCWMVLNGWS